MVQPLKTRGISANLMAISLNFINRGKIWDKKQKDLSQKDPGQRLIWIQFTQKFLGDNPRII